jgi:ArsR family transcriptional regulator
VVGTSGFLLSEGNQQPIGVAEAVSLARTLSALADPVRIQVLSIVASRGEICSCDLIGPLAKSQPTISHHTTILANAGILIGEKRGRWTWWRVAPESLDHVRRALGAVGPNERPA